ncbi:MAG TPA: Uma2 family endonuclease [Bryobacterales bacterium]|nr:Uma2 family endonuclease [Bryobacterales bacterium]
MATHTQVSLEEYLRASYEPDAEYLDGEIVERNVGEYPHSNAQANLTGLFYSLRKKLPLHACTELRLRLAHARYRVADLAVFAPEAPTENVPSSPPLIIVEIVSRDDGYTQIMEKLEEYRAWGVAHVWLVDPWVRKLYVYTAGLSEVPAFQVPEYNLELPAAEIFS